MRLKDLDFIQLLPVFMKKDPAVQALSSVMTQTLADPDEHLKDAATWNRIDRLSDKELDDLAWEFDVDWYDYSASKEVKISQIRSALLIKKRRGTNWAVTQILADIWGWAYTREWYEFSGEPYTFEVVVKDKITTQKMFDKLIALIGKAKNVRSRLVRVYYEEEHTVAIELRPVYHVGPFHLPQCNDLYPGGYHLIGNSEDAPTICEVQKDKHAGTFKLPQCNACVCNG